VIRQFPKNTVVVSQGDETDSFYVILQGKVDVFLHNDKGKEIIINTLGECEAFGELAPLGRIPRQASIITTEDSTFGIISRQVFMDTLLTKPTVSMQIIDLLVHRIQDLTEEVSSLALEDVYNRVVRVLYKHAEAVGEKLITEKLTQQDIASRVGATREMVHRILKELKTGGYISIEGKHITIEKKLPAGW
jgi:CRP/FNR family cyclic AMP-dependent transcriptional regulator